MIDLVLSFLNHGVLFNMQIVDSSPVDFPAVTFRNLNSFDRRYAQEFIDTVLNENNMSYVKNLIHIDLSPTQVIKFLSASVAAKSLNDTEKRRLGFDLDYMLLSCSFNGEECNSSDFVWSHNFDFG